MEVSVMASESAARTDPKRVDALANMVATLREELRDVREELGDVREAHERERERRKRLEERVDDLDGRTDLLQLVEAADDADGVQRSVALLMDAKRTIEASDDAHRVEYDHDDADAALHRPDVDRTTIYADMERAARLVGDEDVAHYRDGVLVVDLSQGSVQPTIRQHARGEDG